MKNNDWLRQLLKSAAPDIEFNFLVGQKAGLFADNLHVHGEQVRKEGNSITEIANLIHRIYD